MFLAWCAGVCCHKHVISAQGVMSNQREDGASDSRWKSEMITFPSLTAEQNNANVSLLSCHAALAGLRLYLYFLYSVSCIYVLPASPMFFDEAV